MPWDLPAERIPDLAASILSIAVAAFLVYMNPRNWANRVFAIYLFLIGIEGLAIALRIMWAAADLGVAMFWRHVQEAAGASLVFVVLLFLVVWPHRRALSGSARAPLAIISGAWAAWLLLFLIDPALHHEWLVTPDGGSRAIAAGPLSLVVLIPHFQLAALVLVWQWTRAPPGRLRGSLGLVAAGFAFLSAFYWGRDTMRYLLALSGDPDTLEAIAPGIGMSVRSVIPYWDGLFIVATAGVLTHAGFRSTERTLGRRAWYLLGGMVLIIALSAAVRLRPDAPGLLVVWTGLVYALVPMLVVIALLRHQLFDIDVKIKWTLRQSTVAAIFVGLFFVVSESAAQFFSERVGTYMGIVAAGALVFAIAPLQHFAQRVADRAMPGVKAVGEMTEDERLRLYMDQVHGAWRDGSLSRDERDMLERLRIGLGLSVEEAHRAEAEAMSSGGV